MLKKKLEVHEHDGIRTSLRCIDILGAFGSSVCTYITKTCTEGREADSTRLAEPDDLSSTKPAVDHGSDSTSLVTRLVEYSLEGLRNGPWKQQQKCANILSALSLAGGWRFLLSSPQYRQRS